MSNDAYQINNDVLLTESGIAFLIEGNHSVLNYITEKTKPTAESFENFTNNITRRAYISHLGKCKYLHVIFPDKQSVLKEEFPIKGIIQLGNKYLEKVNIEPLKSLIIYPVEELKKHKDAFQKLDTHLSDKGSLLVIERILAKLDESAPEALRELKNLINDEITNHGDLGLKFTPPLSQKIKALKSNWNYRKFCSNGTFHNGQIDIYLTPEAAINKKVLIFGDSFFRLMLTHLSKIFREVVFLRTPYLHVEMVELIKPDIILTGNSERYLANVSSDANAPAFQLYSYSHNSTQKPSPLFINAFRAVTSPNAQSSKDYFSKIFNTSLQPLKMVGPSHMVRWTQHLKYGLLSNPASTKDLIGYGGAPIWSKRLLDATEKDLTLNTKVLLMVGDFRFGNEVCLQPVSKREPLFISQFYGINSKAITPENDAYMANRCKSALAVWNSKFNNQINFIFWDLFCRQVQDRLSARHIKNKKYQHPHWTLASIQALVPESRLIDLAPLLKLPMHEVLRLFIDASSHPSHIGYLTIINCFVHGSDALSAYNKAVYDVEDMLIPAILKLLKRKGMPVVICGRSVWIDTLMRYLGATGVEKLKTLGLFIIASNGQIGHAAPSPLTLNAIDESHIIFISENGSLSDVPSMLFPKAPPIISTLAWEASCGTIIRQRNETPRALHGDINPVIAHSATINLNDLDIELGPFGYPSISGLLKVINHL